MPINFFRMLIWFSEAGKGIAITRGILFDELLANQEPVFSVPFAGEVVVELAESRIKCPKCGPPKQFEGKWNMRKQRL